MHEVHPPDPKRGWRNTLFTVGFFLLFVATLLAIYGEEGHLMRPIALALIAFVWILAARLI